MGLPSEMQPLTLLVGKHLPCFLPRGLKVLDSKGLLAIWPLLGADRCGSCQAQMEQD